MLVGALTGNHGARRGCVTGDHARGSLLGLPTCLWGDHRRTFSLCHLDIVKENVLGFPWHVVCGLASMKVSAQLCQSHGSSSHQQADHQYLQADLVSPVTGMASMQTSGAVASIVVTPEGEDLDEVLV
jgi:hypothetical protein